MLKTGVVTNLTIRGKIVWRGSAWAVHIFHDGRWRAVCGFRCHEKTLYERRKDADLARRALTQEGLVTVEAIREKSFSETIRIMNGALQW